MSRKHFYREPGFDWPQRREGGWDEKRWDQRPNKGKGPRNNSRLDERIHDDICDRLTRHPLIDASLVEVQILNGEVTLTGEVLDRRMKNIIEDVLDEVSGVKEINNDLRVNRDRAA